jgi:hypothetical protein
LPAQNEAERDGDQEYRHDDRDDDPQGLRGHTSTLSRARREVCSECPNRSRRRRSVAAG